jgi:hypothetical protein
MLKDKNKINQFKKRPKKNKKIKPTHCRYNFEYMKLNKYTYTNILFYLNM